MKCVLLVAGFATRLYPLTLNTPKPLLDVGGKTILDRLMDKVAEVPQVDEVILVSNGKFFPHFVRWVESRSKQGLADTLKMVVLNDGALDNERRLGAVADLSFAVKEAGLKDDALVLAGDNLFDFSLKDFVDFFRSQGTDCVTAHRLEDPNQLRRTGVVVVDPSGRVLEFEEKPKDPKSFWAVPPIYLYRKDTLPLVEQYLQEGNNPDAPGNFVPWLLRRKTVHAYFFKGNRYDIGTPESLEEARRRYAT